MASHGAEAKLQPIYIAIIGVGGVGKEVLSQLPKIRTQHPRLAVALIASSKKCLKIDPASSITTAAHSIDLETWSDQVDNLPEDAALSPPQIISHLKTLPGPTIFIDNTSSQAVVDTYPSLLRAGISLVTPNKKGFSSPLPFWKEIFSASRPQNPHGGFLYHESTVGAGLPIISTLKDLIATGDKVRKIEGVFSGTMSYIFNNFNPLEGGGAKFSDVVAKAKDAGFTEPDPRDDLNGMDVARKVIILARLAGLQVESLEEVPTESLIPKELEGVGSAEEFLARLPEFDWEMEGVKREAEEMGRVVRYVGSIDLERGELKVGLEKFEKGGPIAGLKGSDNIVSFYTERYGENPLVVQGAGAGGAVTAMGVTSDLIKVLQQV